MNSKPLRSAGGHIHIGHEFPRSDDFNRLAVVRMMDLFVGLPAIYLEHDDTSLARKALYGKAGRFRRPDHGVEFRISGILRLKWLM
jgi:hypothetical protein